MAHIICWQSGLVEVADDKPHGAISLMQGARHALERRLITHARHAYDGKSLLVPGVPEAETEAEKLAAVKAFAARLEGGKRRRAA
jgi:hypothetical protein